MYIKEIEILIESKIFKKIKVLPIITGYSLKLLTLIIQ